MAKLSKSDVRYEIAKPEQDHCAECKWFLRPDRCELVKGEISPNGWCKVFHAARSRGARIASKADSDREYVRRMRGADAR